MIRITPAKIFFGARPRDGLSLASLADQATELVREHWDAVSALAEALMARERLDYHEVLQVLDSVLDNSICSARQPTVTCVDHGMIRQKVGPDEVRK